MNTNTESGGSGSGSFSTTGATGTLKDLAWKYFTLVDPPKTCNVKCCFCSKILKGGIFRGKQHLAGGYRNAASCKDVPANVRLEIKMYMDAKKLDKLEEARNILEENMYPEDDEDVRQSTTSRRSQPLSNSESSNPLQNKRKHQIFMDKFVQHKGKERQTTLNEAYKKEVREKAVLSIARWLYDAAIPLNAITYPSFREMVNDISLHGAGFKPPSYHEVRVPCLSKIVKEVEDDYVSVCRAEWAKYGCSLMVDGWTDKRQRTLINFLVNSPRGSIFIESVDASDYAKTGTAMCDLLDKFVERVGEENVVQIITDNASNMKLGGK